MKGAPNETLTRVGLLVQLANHYTTRGALHTVCVCVCVCVCVNKSDTRKKIEKKNPKEFQIGWI